MDMQNGPVFGSVTVQLAVRWQHPTLLMLQKPEKLSGGFTQGNIWCLPTDP